jgi:spore germination cell wall hydrolase CwlJ-like protein
MKTFKLGILAITMLTTIGLGTGSLAAPKTKFASRIEINCLAKNIYHEARGEPLHGQIAVAQVTINRVASGKFQNNICNVVYADRQFSWTIGRTKKIKDIKAWEASVAVATAVLTNSIHLPDFKALYFHTKQVKPRWKYSKRVVAVIGNHIFYS